jgi:hypothetical protein
MVYYFCGLVVSKTLLLVLSHSVDIRMIYQHSSHGSQSSDFLTPCLALTSEVDSDMACASG